MKAYNLIAVSLIVILIGVGGFAILGRSDLKTPEVIIVGSPSEIPTSILAINGRSRKIYHSTLQISLTIPELFLHSTRILTKRLSTKLWNGHQKMANRKFIFSILLV